jgi:hypothetical protein
MALFGGKQGKEDAAFGNCFGLTLKYCRSFMKFAMHLVSMHDSLMSILKTGKKGITVHADG